MLRMQGQYIFINDVIKSKLESLGYGVRSPADGDGDDDGDGDGDEEPIYQSQWCVYSDNFTVVFTSIDCHCHSRFCRAMLYKRGLCRHAVSCVRPSVCHIRELCQNE